MRKPVVSGILLIVQETTRYEVEYPMCVPGEIFRAIGHDNRREDVNPFIICISGEKV